MADSDDEDAFASADEDAGEETQRSTVIETDERSDVEVPIEKAAENDSKSKEKIDEESLKSKETEERSKTEEKNVVDNVKKVEKREKVINKEEKEESKVKKQGSEKKTKPGNKTKTARKTLQDVKAQTNSERTQKEPDDMVEENTELKKTTKAVSNVDPSQTKNPVAEVKEVLKENPVAENRAKVLGSPSPDSESVKCSSEEVSYRKRLSSRESGEDKTEVTNEEVKDPRSALERLTADNKEDSSGWGWNSLSSWGTSVLSTASSSVNTFTNQVGAGLTQVLHSVESGFTEETDDDTSENNATAAESLISQDDKDAPVVTKQVDNTPLVNTDISTTQSEVNPAQEDRNRQDKSEDGDGWFASWGLSVVGEVVNKTSSVVQQTTSASKKVVTGGLDVLETIGKKTFDILTEGDHGLKIVIDRSRNKPNLSQTLREAKEEAEKHALEEEAYADSRKTNFSAQFDDFHGLVQLEALEMLSSSSESRLKKVLDVLPEDDSESITSQLIDVKMMFDKVAHDNAEGDAASDDDFSNFITEYRGRMSLIVDTQKLLNAHESVMEWLKDFNEVQKSEKSRTAHDIHCKSIESLASVTAATVEHFHRASQLLLQSTAPTSASCNTVALCLSHLTTSVCSEINHLTSRLVQCLMSISDSGAAESVTEIITNIYLESGNSSTYVRDAFQLLLPVLQLSIVRAHPSCKDLIDN